MLPDARAKASRQKVRRQAKLRLTPGQSVTNLGNSVSEQGSHAKILPEYADSSRTDA